MLPISSILSPPTTHKTRRLTSLVSVRAVALHGRQSAEVSEVIGEQEGTGAAIPGRPLQRQVYAPEGNGRKILSLGILKERVRHDDDGALDDVAQDEDVKFFEALVDGFGRNGSRGLICSLATSTKLFFSTITWTSQILTLIIININKLNDTDM